MRKGTLVALAVVGLVMSANAAEKWKPAVDVSSVEVTIHRLAATELNRLGQRYWRGASAKSTNVLAGFSVLTLNRETGKSRCDVYLRENLRTREFVTTLAHEITHCAGLRHD